MNQQKKAELQRRLSMAPVARPPADLLDRLKNDIPNPVPAARTEEERLRPGAFNFRIAASLLIVVATAYLSVQLFSRGERPQIAVSEKASSRNTAPAPSAQAEPSSNRAFSPSAAAPASPALQQTAAAKDAPQQPFVRENAENTSTEQPAAAPARQLRILDRVEPQIAEGAVSGAIGGAQKDAVANTSEQPAVRAEAPPPPAAPVRAEARQTRAVEPATGHAKATAPAFVTRDEAATVTAGAPLMPAAAPVSQALSPAVTPRRLFGISVEPGAFDRIKDALESGRQVVPSTVDVSALVNYFAGPAAPPPQELRLEVEASRVPVGSEEETVLVRYTIDGSAAQNAVAATNARLTVTIDSRAVNSQRLIGATPRQSFTHRFFEAQVPGNISATGLVELKLAPGLTRRQQVARIDLQWESGGTHYSAEKIVRAGEVKPWLFASHRHRLATLGAVWSESLREGGGASDVAKTARQLAGEAPGDERAQDLATAATASSPPRSSGSTGSGR